MTTNGTPHVLVTGGAGFIGQTLVRLLLQQGFGVTVLDDLFNAPEPADPGRKVSYKFVKGSVHEPAKVREALNEATHVVHLAAQASVPQSVQDPADTFRRNVLGTEVLLEEVRQKHAQGAFPGWVVLASSAAVYGKADGRQPLPEVAAQGQVLASPYAASKLINEIQGAAMKACYGVPVVSLRLFNVYGPGQRADHPYAGFVAKVVHSIRSGELLTIFGDGRQTRDFIAVEDVASAIKLMLIRPAQLAPQTPDVLNVGTGTAVSLLDAIRQVVAITRVNPRVAYKPLRAGDLPASCANPMALMRILPSWKPLPLHEGLRRWLTGGV